VSLAQIEQFYALAQHDGPLQDKLVADGIDTAQLAASAVREAGTLGYRFTHQEALAWMRSIQMHKASGELNDHQLEAVAGGKSPAKKPGRQNSAKPPPLPNTTAALAQLFKPRP
jgi:hypothetical protein